MKRFFATGLGLAMVFMLAGASLAGLNDGLVAYYPFNGNANDESGNGYHGTVEGATLTSDRFGNPNSAYHFSGSEYIKIAGGAGISFPAGLTVSVWVKIDQFTPYDPQTFVDKWVPYGEVFSLEINCTSNCNTWDRPHFGVNINNSIQSITSPNPVSLNAWTQIIGVFDNLTLKIYVNGSLSASKSQTGTISNSQSYFVIGAHDSWDHNWAYGSVDDIRIYNRALSESEIMELYNPTTTTTTTTIIPSSTTTTTMFCGLKGDINDDGKIGLDEAIYALQVAAGISPAKERILFVFEKNGDKDIWIMNTDGTNANSLLTWSGSNEYSPKISPDGKSIAFISNKSGKDDIWVMNSDGTNPRQITHGGNVHWAEISWYPDGNRLCYGAASDGIGIYAVNIDGTNQQLVKHHPGSLDYMPRIDPVSGRYLVFTYDSGNWGPTANTVVFDTVQNTETTIVPGSWNKGRNDYEWSPDATKIAMPVFESGVSSKGSIYTINSDGSQLKAIITFANMEEVYTDLSWSPNGQKIVCSYQNYTSSRRSIYVLDADGTNQRELYFSSDGSCFAPNWAVIR